MEDKKYEITCPACGAELLTQKSLFHHMGLFEHGRGECLKCNQLMQIEFLPNEDKMQTRIWNEWVKEFRTRNDIEPNKAEA